MLGTQAGQARNPPREVHWREQVGHFDKVEVQDVLDGRPHLRDHSLQSMRGAEAFYLNGSNQRQVEVFDWHFLCGGRDGRHAAPCRSRLCRVFAGANSNNRPHSCRSWGIARRYCLPGTEAIALRRHMILCHFGILVVYRYGNTRDVSASDTR